MKVKLNVNINSGIIKLSPFYLYIIPYSLRLSPALFASFSCIIYIMSRLLQLKFIPALSIATIFELCFLLN